MRITEVSAVVRYSAEAKGNWRAIELAGTASLTSSDETLESVSDELYKRLTKQLKVLWGSNKAEGGENKRETQAETQNPNWCTTHNTEFKKFSKEGQTWLSHKNPDGTWHNQGK